MAARTNVRSLFLDELKDWAERRGFDGYRASQVAGWLYNRPPAALADMHNLPASLREALAEDFDTDFPEQALVATSEDTTRKVLVRLADGKLVESVLIPREERITLCISSQVGCALACDYCATARLGLARNLEPFEIVAQVMLARELARPEPLTNYVFMGMGEPLANYDRLARETSVNLAVSLGSARDEVRDVLMPVNKRWNLAELIAVCKRLELPRRKRITFEYTMLDGVNDGDEDVRALIRLLHGVPTKLNLIPFNAFDGSGYRSSPWERIEAFQEKLLAAGIHTTVRRSRGRDIKAACGQLAASAAA